MGVTGLWRLIEPAGKPVPVETLENKVLAVDISIWLHQVVKGYQDARGAPMPNAHLMGLFQRLCKLLYFRIKPVFVFDGGFPELKRETIAKRHDSKTKYNSESERLKRELAVLLSKKTAIGSILGHSSPPKKAVNPLQTDDDIFKLPELPPRDAETESESDDEDTSSGSIIDLHSVDVESETFKNMPVKEKYDLLLELKETRKMNSWGRLHELPKKSDNFSNFQMQRLLKRRKVQECLAETEKEMGVNTLSLNEIESLLNEEGIETKIDSLPTSRIASSDTTRYLLIKDLKKVRSEIEAKKMEVRDSEANKIDSGDSEASCSKKAKVDELEEDLEKAIKMSLECVDTGTDVNTTNSSQSDFDSSMWESYSSSSEEELTVPDMSSAKAYIMQYSDFTDKAIEDIVSCTKGKKKRNKPINVEDIIEELNAEKTVLADNVELSSGDECVAKDTDKHVDSDISLNVKPNSCEYNSVIVIDSNTSQSSIAIVNNSVPEIINLDSSSNETNEFNPVTKPPLPNNESSNESSDDDFEEVVDDNDKFVKPVVQLNLNMGTIPEDDIFADIFNSQPEKQQIIDGKQNNAIMEHVHRNHLELETKSFENIELGHDEQFKGVVDDNAKFVKPNTNTGEVEEFANASNENPEIIDKEIKETQINVKEIKDKGLECQRNRKNNSRPTVKISEEIIVKDTLITQDIKSPEEEIIKEPMKEKLVEPLTREELNIMVDKIEERQNEIIQEKGRLDRIGRNITEEMTRDVKELLRIFGIPYIVAPMEAEAQCAFLESIKLTDGTITDDSDIWLFGGQTVYKNFFNQKKHVLQFVSDRIEKSFNLSREQLVLLALLVGSDYTTGVMGVGPVTALEILASFPYNKKDLSVDLPKQARYSKLVNGLQEFKKWVKAGKRTENTVLKKKLRNVDVADDFPSTRVVQAYFEPNVNKNDETFTWGEINITILRDYAKTKFGWSQYKFDEIINPVIKRLVEHKSQTKIQDFFKRKVEYESLEEQMSKRVKAAIQKMGLDEQIVEENKDSKKPKRKRKLANKAIKATKDTNEPGTSQDELKNVVKTVTETQIIDSKVEIKVPKLNRYQEIIPQREKDKKYLLENRLKAIEIFRKSTIDKKVKKTKRKVVLPKEDAGLSESDSD